MSLQRFHEAQSAPRAGHITALGEVHSGGKQSHWIWYIFPQLAGLGYSSTASFYALRNLDEACDYLRDPVLRARYGEIATAVAMQLEKGASVGYLLSGSTDALKLVSSLTLFRAASIRLAETEATPEYSSIAKLCDSILRLTASQGYPPCTFTIERCTDASRGKRG
ncbi:MAG: DUF1810 family protein [Pedosphaera sp.]|nr:DUF1810 family protein [Pedosphaera sp.]